MSIVHVKRLFFSTFATGGVYLCVSMRRERDQEDIYIYLRLHPHIPQEKQNTHLHPPPLLLPPIKKKSHLPIPPPPLTPPLYNPPPKTHPQTPTAPKIPHATPAPLTAPDFPVAAGVAPPEDEVEDDDEEGDAEPDWSSVPLALANFPMYWVTVMVPFLHVGGEGALLVRVMSAHWVFYLFFGLVDGRKRGLMDGDGGWGLVTL